MGSRKRKKSSYLKKVLICLLLVTGIGIGLAGYKFYTMVYQPNVTLAGKKTEYFYIPTEADLEDVVNALYERNYIINRNSFEWVAERKNYRNHVKAGRYRIAEHMNNNQLINLLRSGKQEPVTVTFNNIRTKEDLAGKAMCNLEADSLQLLELLSNSEFIGGYGFEKHTIITMFIPNTYEFYWNTSAEQFCERMATEYKKFWTKERIAKAEAKNLSQSETAVLASIVQQETRFNKEKQIVAGVYLNRLRKPMLLQADPTVIYAWGDFSITRVLNKHKEIDSRYNTYKYQGLPPGPICLPSISSIDAVLNAEQHDYIYFCAKPDFSGYHSFAKTYTQHRVNARKYQQALNNRGIYN